MQRCDERIEVYGRPQLTVDDGNAYLAAGLAGLGMLWLPQYMARPHLISGELVPLAHRDPDGDLPADRAWDAGYRGRQIGENIAAGQGSPSKAMAGWLASPGHCANLMNPMFTQVGAAFAENARSDEGVYWTMVFGAP